MQSEQPVESDDPTITYMLQAGARLCKCLGEEFLPYLDVVMPPLLRSAQLKPDVNVADNDTDEDDEEDDEVRHTYRTFVSPCSPPLTRATSLYRESNFVLYEARSR